MELNWTSDIEGGGAEIKELILATTLVGIAKRDNSSLKDSIQVEGWVSPKEFPPLLSGVPHPGSGPDLSHISLLPNHMSHLNMYLLFSLHAGQFLIQFQIHMALKFINLHPVFNHVLLFFYLSPVSALFHA